MGFLENIEWKGGVDRVVSLYGDLVRCDPRTYIFFILDR